MESYRERADWANDIVAWYAEEQARTDNKHEQLGKQPDR